MPKAFPEEFRRDVVAVARRRQAPMSQIARGFGISESCLARWVKRAEIEDGVREGLTLAEEAEIRELPLSLGPRYSRSCQSSLCTWRRSTGDPPFLAHKRHLSRREVSRRRGQFDRSVP